MSRHVERIHLVRKAGDSAAVLDLIFDERYSLGGSPFEIRHEGALYRVAPSTLAIFGGDPFVIAIDYVEVTI